MGAEDEWQKARQRSRWSSVSGGAIGLVLISALGFPAAYLANLTSSGVLGYAMTVLWLGLLIAPLVVILTRRTLREQLKTDAVVGDLTRELSDAVTSAARQAAERERQGRGQKFESRLANALDMAEGEPEVITVIERAFTSVLPQTPVELLLADNSHAHLLRMAHQSPSGEPPGCSVDSPDHCPAARRGQVQRFGDSGDLDACPKLRDRVGGAVSALCVPVSIMGRTVGVIHSTGQPGSRLDESAEQAVEVLAKLAGARIGLLRVMAETQLQAATDSLTGLLNRRSFEQRVSLVRRTAPTMALAIADLDHFKALNDTYGHETGDRALRLYAQVLNDSVRTQDITGRHGGEEFVLAFPNCTGRMARGILDALSARLQAAITVAGLPRFTVSVGVVDCDPDEGLPAAVGRADVALFQAKRNGRDQTVLHDPAGRCIAEPDLVRTMPTEADRQRHDSDILTR